MGLPGGLAGGYSRPRVARVVGGIVSSEEKDGVWPAGLAAIVFIASGVPNWERLSQMPNKFVFVREFKMIISQKFE